MWFEPYEGNRYFPGLHVCYTIFYSKLACGIEKSGGKIRGWMAPKMSQLDFLCWPHQVFFYFLFYLSKEANGPNFKPKLLVRVPEVSHHHIHDWNLINLGSIDLHHSLSIALPRLQHETQRHRKQMIREAEINGRGFSAPPPPGAPTPRLSRGKPISASVSWGSWGGQDWTPMSSGHSRASWCPVV